RGNVEILSRLPVKLLITDPKFAKKHLSLSATTYSLHCLSYFHIYITITSYSRDDSVLTNVTTTNISQLGLPLNRNVYFVGSCNGILCLANECADSIRIQSWNPSIRKFKELPPLVEPQNFSHYERMYGFGYDPVNDNYKVVLVSRIK
ncbi:F-box protein, partial [Trifolium pratense]